MLLLNIILLFFVVCRVDSYLNNYYDNGNDENNNNKYNININNSNDNESNISNSNNNINNNNVDKYPENAEFNTNNKNNKIEFIKESREAHKKKINNFKHSKRYLSSHSHFDENERYNNNKNNIINYNNNNNKNDNFNKNFNNSELHKATKSQTLSTFLASSNTKRRSNSGSSNAPLRLKTPAKIPSNHTCMHPLGMENGELAGCV